MNGQIDLIVKVIVLSGILSFAVKYGGRFLPLPQTSTVALMLVFLPTIIVGLILLWRRMNSI